MGLKIKETGRGYDWFGNCEVCNKRCDNHYMQSGLDTEKSKFGHLDCLKIGLFKDADVIKIKESTK